MSTTSKMASPRYRPNRRKAGQVVSAARHAAGLSQSGLARRLGLNVYTFVSQVETGAKRLPTEQIPTWAYALGISDVTGFARTLMRYYDPEMYQLVFPDPPATRPRRPQTQERHP